MTTHSHEDWWDGGAIRGRVEDFLAALEFAEVDRPHVVLSIDADGGSLSCSGPYASGFLALEAAEAERLAYGDDSRISVVPLYPPVQPTALGQDL